jgi:hypothetical protein
LAAPCTSAGGVVVGGVVGAAVDQECDGASAIRPRRKNPTARGKDLFSEGRPVRMDSLHI